MADTSLFLRIKQDYTKVLNTFISYFYSSFKQNFIFNARMYLVQAVLIFIHEKQHFQTRYISIYADNKIHQRLKFLPNLLE